MFVLNSASCKLSSPKVRNEVITYSNQKTASRPKENGSMESLMSEPLHPAKRHHPNSPVGSRISPNASLNLGSGAPIRLEDISLSREMRERERLERERAERERVDRERERDRHFSGNYNFNRSDSFDPLERLDDDWRHVETMLNCILGMVDKTKRAMAVLQERSLRDREELTVWMRRHAEGMDHDVKKHTNDMMAFTVRQTEDRVSDVRRRAEEAVNEVKRQAMLELQKAVAAAENKASEMVISERVKMERVLQQARSQARDEVLGTVNHQEESSESCWNCGRKASETCSGCNVARYCGSFCQHKDWENHHLVCGKAQVAAIAQARDHRRGVPATTTITSSSSSSSAAGAGAGSSSSSSQSCTTTGPASSGGSVSGSGGGGVMKEMPSTTTIITLAAPSSAAADLTQTQPVRPGPVPAATPSAPPLSGAGSDVTATSSVTTSSSTSLGGSTGEVRAVSPVSESEKSGGGVGESSR